MHNSIMLEAQVRFFVRMLYRMGLDVATLKIACEYSNGDPNVLLNLLVKEVKQKQRDQRELEEQAKKV